MTCYYGKNRLNGGTVARNKYTFVTVNKQDR